MCFQCDEHDGAPMPPLQDPRYYRVPSLPEAVGFHIVGRLLTGGKRSTMPEACLAAATIRMVTAQKMIKIIIELPLGSSR
jgi:hypothetical protein